MNKKLRLNQEGKIKLLFSLALLIFSLGVAMVAKNKYIFLAMLCSSAGDILIMSSRGCITGKKENQFENGVIAFAMAHLAYMVAMPTELSDTCLYIAIWCFVLIIFLNFNAKIKQGIWICIPYAVCLALNAVNSWSFSTFAGIGGILFLVSDAILSVFEKKSPKWQLAIWVTYVPAQICLLTANLINA